MNAKLKRHFEAMEAVKADFLKLMGKFDEAGLRKSPEGKWNALQVMNHLIEAEKLSVEYLEKALAKEKFQGRGGIGAKIRSFVLNRALKSKRQFRAPRIVASPSADGDLKAAIESWAQLRADLRQLLEGFPPKRLGMLVYKHPRAGWLTIGQFLSFVGEHIRHHIPQVERLLAT